MEPIQLKFTIWHLFRLLDVGILPLAVFYFALAIVSTALVFRALRLNMTNKLLFSIASLALLAMSCGVLDILYNHIRNESIRQFCLDAVKGGRAPRTASKYLELLEESGRYPQWCSFQRGVIALQLGNYEEAQSRFAAIVKESPKHEIAWFNLIQATMSSRKLTLAEKYIAQATDVLDAAAPGKFAALKIRLLILQKKKTEAKKAIKQAIADGYLPPGFDGGLGP